jgi:hypothetical protein
VNPASTELFAVTGWNPHMRWVGPGAWGKRPLTDALIQCTSLQSTDAKRLARRLLSRELVEFAIVDREGKAKYVAHILESLGAKTEIRLAGGRVAG